MQKDTGFAEALNELDNLIGAMMIKDEKARWDLAPLKLHIVQVRIENEKLLAMYDQNKLLYSIAEAIKRKQ